MLDTKNPSPVSLSLITASVVATANTLLSFLLRPEWWQVCLVAGTSFLVTYTLYYYTLQRFIYRKIKLIYKFIYQTKATPREEFFNHHILPQKSLNDVSKDVAQWADRHNSEIENLRAHEAYRKEFLMNLAHELRTPIFGIQGYVETLLAGALEDATVNKKFLAATSKSVDRLVDLVNDLDQISRLEGSEAGLHQEHFSLQELITEVYDEFALRAAEKGVRMEIKKGSERSLMVFADKPKIRQVLANLIDNALKYGRIGNTITTCGYVMDEGRAYVEVSDDGPGIPEEHLPRIFERFYRADRSRSRQIGGTGLGLAIVKHIVEAHGQTLTVRSKPGVGSSFGFTLERSPS
ncbi:MAG: sensor histidine kinase [Bacteroidetes bacterium]|nr:sensor histidine kinase [Bacteroidota bacterium]MBS1630746.1 sensor histidine kinase [Bacteroidota bacterium]